MKKPIWSFTILLMLVFLLPVSTNAVPIAFTFTGNGTGILFGDTQNIEFVDADFVIHSYGDTDNRIPHPLGINALLIEHDYAFIEIEGVGTLDFITQTRTFINDDTNGVGFSRSGDVTYDLFNAIRDPALDGWDMLSSIGPISTTGRLLQWDRSEEILTSLGDLEFEDETGIEATFEAQLGVSPVPEPATLLLLGTCLAGIAGFGRKKFFKK